MCVHVFVDALVRVCAACIPSQAGASASRAPADKAEEEDIDALLAALDGPAKPGADAAAAPAEAPAPTPAPAEAAKEAGEEEEEADGGYAWVVQCRAAAGRSGPFCCSAERWLATPQGCCSL